MRSLMMVLALLVPIDALAMDAVRVETRTDLAEAQFGVDGSGVTIAVLDRGINYSNQDFRQANGTTRIRAMLDQSGSSSCTTVNEVEYSEAQINAALSGGPALGMRDAVGHGDATAGVAAGRRRRIAAWRRMRIC